MKNIEIYFYKNLKKILKKKTGLHEPVFGKEDVENVTNCINSTFVSTRGNFTSKFEKEISKLTNTKHVIATNSGTSALELGLRVLGVQSCDEILVPALTFVATVNAIKYCNATPHFVDSCEHNLGIDVNKLEKYLIKNSYKKGKYFFNKKTNNRIYAILPVHVFGMPGDIEGILKLSKRFNLKLLEDATEALGSKFKNKQMGTFGDIGVLSFNANKIITAGAGGCLLTNNKKYAKLALHISTTSKVLHPWLLKHDSLGWNIRMPSLNAALGYDKIKEFNKIIIKKQKIAQTYFSLFKKTEINLLKEGKDCKSNFWLNTVLLSDKQTKYRNKIIDYCNKKGIGCRPAWNLISEIKIYKKCPKTNLSNAIKIQKKIINLPSGLNILSK